MADDPQPAATGTFGDSTRDAGLSELVDTWLYAWDKTSSSIKRDALLALVGEKADPFPQTQNLPGDRSRLITDLITVNGRKTTLLNALLSSPYRGTREGAREVFDRMKKTLAPEELAKALSYRDANGDDALTLAFRARDYALFADMVKCLPGTLQEKLARYDALLDEATTKEGLEALQAAFGKDEVNKALAASIARRSKELSDGNRYLETLNERLKAEEPDSEKRKLRAQALLQERRGQLVTQLLMLHAHHPDVLRDEALRDPAVRRQIGDCLADDIQALADRVGYSEVEKQTARNPDFALAMERERLFYRLREEGFFAEDTERNYGSPLLRYKALTLTLIDRDWPTATPEMKQAMIAQVGDDPEMMKYLYEKDPKAVIRFVRNPENHYTVAELGCNVIGTPDEGFFRFLLNHAPEPVRVQVLQDILCAREGFPVPAPEAIGRRVAFVRQAMGATNPSLYSIQSDPSLLNQMVNDLDSLEAGDPQKAKQFLDAYDFILEKGWFTAEDLDDRWYYHQKDGGLPRKPDRQSAKEVFAARKEQLQEKYDQAVKEWEEFNQKNNNAGDPEEVKRLQKNVADAGGRLRVISLMEEKYEAAAARRQELSKLREWQEKQRIERDLKEAERYRRGEKNEVEKTHEDSQGVPALPPEKPQGDIRQNGAVLTGSGVTYNVSEFPGQSVPSLPMRGGLPVLGA
jgi:hypothetical protein